MATQRPIIGPDPVTLIPGTRFGPYEIAAQIGAGGMGEVFRATDTTLGRQVAIKVLPEAVALDADRLSRFDREARTLAALNHPNIAAIYGLEKSDGTTALVMELVEGPTLAERIAEGRIAVEEALPIARQIAEALEAAHDQGIIHRDLKPANVKLRPDGTVKVLDFGLAKAIEPAAALSPGLSQSPTITTPAMTQAGLILGTAAYMSPEQARGRPLDRRTDVWAFGAVLFEMLTGSPAFRGEDVGLTLAEVIKSEPAWTSLPAGLPPPVGRLLRRCLDKEPRRRLRDIGEARIVLEDAQAGRGAVELEGGTIEPRRPWAWMAVSAGLALALGALLVFGPPASSPERVRRYALPLPRDGLTFSFALSPDGRYIAAESVIGLTTQVFLQALDSWELRPMPGTEGAGNPFWSPDGRHIAFFAREKLQSVPVTGGPAEELADVPGILGARGTWGRTGVILVAGSSKYDPGPLRSVPATGGEPVPLTTTEPGERHLYPQFLPDGRRFLYTSTGGSAPGIYVASLDEPAGRRLLADVSSAHVAVADDGTADLLFVRNGSLTALPFDLERLTVSDEPTVLVELTVPAADDGSAALSVAGDGTLAYAGGSFREAASRFAWFDRSGTFVREERPAGPPAPVALAPDGSAMVLSAREPGQWMSDLWRRDLTRGSETRLTFDTRVDVASNVVWSPDGRRILFTMAPAFDLFSMDPYSTTPPEPFLASGRPKYPSDWSRDGRYVVYTELGEEGVADIWYLEVREDERAGGVPSTEGVPFLQTPYLESSGRLSPDGRWIAYMSDESGDREVYVRPFPIGAGQWKISSGRAAHPIWSGNGDELFYVTGPASRRTLTSVRVTRQEPASSDRRAVFETGVPDALLDLPMNDFHPATSTIFYAPSADGQQFLVNYIDLTEDPVLRIVTNWREAFGLAPPR